MMKFLCFAMISFAATIASSAFANNLSPLKPEATAAISSDTQIFNFLLGDWKLSGGSCLSGAPINWGTNFNDIEFITHFGSDLSYSQLSYKKGLLQAETTGSFSVSRGLLTFNQAQTCTYEPNQETCMSSNTDNFTTMVSIQGNQLWLLMSMGANSGSCPAHDVTTLKFDRQ